MVRIVHVPFTTPVVVPQKALAMSTERLVSSEGRRAPLVGSPTVMNSESLPVPSSIPVFWLTVGLVGLTW